MKVDLDGIHNIGNKDIQKYTLKKMSKLDKYIPRHARKSAYADVRLKEKVNNDKKECTCEVVLHVPGENITAKETTMNMFAAVDIVEEKVKSQLRKYKEKNIDKKRSPIKRVLRRFRSSDE